MVKYKSYKGRKLGSGVRTYVYRNLNNGLISLRQGNLVIGHAEEVVLKDVEVKVSEAGRKRVLKEKVKNVHAYLTGVVVEGEFEEEYIGELYYNPYKVSTFVDKETMEPPLKIKNVKVRKDGRMYYN